MERSKLIKIATLSVVFLGIATFFWPEKQMDPLDMLRHGDIESELDDITISKDTPLYVIYKHHPKVRGIHESYGNKIDEVTSGAVLIKSVARDGYNKERVVYHIDHYRKFPRDKKSLLVTYARDVNSYGGLYRLTMTVRQGRYFAKTTVERSLFDPGRKTLSFKNPDQASHFFGKYFWYLGNQRRFGWMSGDEGLLLAILSEKIEYLDSEKNND